MAKKVTRVAAADRREQLIDATISVMRRDGVSSVTMRGVAAEAKASLAALHYCFEDKEALLQAAIQRWQKQMVTDTMRVSPGGGIRSCTKQMVEAWWEALETAPEEIQAQFELPLWAIRGERTRDLAATIYPSYIAEMRDMFSRALNEAGETCDFDLERFSRSLLVIIDGCTLQHLSDKTSDARLMCDDLVENLLTKVGKSTCGGRSQIVVAAR
jgi:AcrR family transcriptional regulator